MTVGRHWVAAVLVAVLMLAACSGDDPADESTTAPSTMAPALTAPPTLSPEDQAEAEIKATFEELIADWDNFKTNASDYGGTPAWNIELVGQWSAEGAANVDLTNWIAAWRTSEIEQVGPTVVASHEVSGLELDVTEQGIHEATSLACLDMSEIRYVDYDGSAAELPATPSRYQHWQMSWTYVPMADPESGWLVGRIEVTLDQPC